MSNDGTLFQRWQWALEKLLRLAQIWHQQQTWKEFKLHTDYAVISEAIKPLQLIGQAAQYKFESKFGPLQVISQSFQRLFQKVIEGSAGEFNGQALGAAFWLCLCW